MPQFHDLDLAESTGRCLFVVCFGSAFSLAFLASYQRLESASLARILCRPQQEHSA